MLFNLWEEWAQLYEDEKNSIDIIEKQQNTEIRPLGEYIAPDWVKYEFKDLEEFYQHYTKLLTVGDKNASK